MQAQLIYPQSNVAAMIAGRLTKSKGVAYVVTKVPTGFQVAPFVPVADTIMKSIAAVAMNEAAAEVAAKKADLAAKSGLLNSLGALDEKVKWVPTPDGQKPVVSKPVVAKALKGPCFTGKYKLMSDAPFYLSVYVEGQPKHFGKPNLVSWKAFTKPGELIKHVEVTMPLAYAKKKGLA
jgi:hypothetical protein